MWAANSGVLKDALVSAMLHGCRRGTFYIQEWIDASLLLKSRPVHVNAKAVSLEGHSNCCDIGLLFLVCLCFLVDIYVETNERKYSPVLLALRPCSVRRFGAVAVF